MLLSLLLTFIILFDINTDIRVSAKVFKQIGTRDDTINSTKYHLNISCESDQVINITDVDVWYFESTGCEKNRNISCNLNSNEKTEVNRKCSGTSECLTTIEFKNECANDLGLAYYRVTSLNSCQPCNITSLQCRGNNAPEITMYPSSVSSCLEKKGIIIQNRIKDALCLPGSNDPSLSPLDIFNDSCLVIQRQIHVLFTCVRVDSFPTHARIDFTKEQHSVSTDAAMEDPKTDAGFPGTEKQEDNGSSAVVIAGVLGGVIFLGLLVVGIFFIYRRRFYVGKRRKKANDKSLIGQNSLQEYSVVQNVAYAAHNGSKALIKPVENSTYQEVVNDVNQNSSKPSSAKRQPQITKNTISSSKKKDDVSNNHTYLDLPNGPFNNVSYAEVKNPKKDTRNWARKNDSYDNAHDFPLSGYSKSGDTNPYSLRKDGVYDTTNIHTQTKYDSYSGNHYDLRMSGTYDTSQAQSKPRPQESDDDVNHYDLRISGTYDTSQALSKPRVREVTDDVNPYDIRVSGTYDSASNVAGRLKNCDDNSENTYDHFSGKKTDGNYDEVTTRSAKPTSSIYGQ